MGCDIHFYLEVKEDDMWINKNKVSINTDWDENLEYPQSDIVLDSIYYDRNYLLFGVLAGVRDTTPQPISHPKGLPDDVSEEIKLFADNYDGHSYSWLTLNELTDYDWDSVGSIYRNCLSFTETVFPEMLDLIKHDPDRYNDVRCVFWFDS